MVAEALMAHNHLSAQGIQTTVVNSRFVKPLDADQIVDLVRPFSRIITIEENVLHGGFGSAVLELLADHGALPPYIKRIGIPDRFIEHGAQSILRAKYGLNADGITTAAHALMKIGNSPIRPAPRAAAT
jgi:1-deoxy-D-xylulose-5-phosphate synthase